MSLPTALLAYRWLYAAFLIVSSAQTIMSEPDARALATVEIIATVLLLFRRTQVLAAATLLLVFAAAAVMTAIAGGLPARFIYFAGTAAFIVLADRRLRATS